MSAPDTILQLVDQFASQLASYRSLEYNEAQARREFIEPFFDVLGWDIYNKQGYAYSYKDVIFEDAIKVGGATKAPDYAFRIGGTRKFFVEAKKPSVNLRDEITPAYQLRRYAWSAKLPLSILTDFEEFAVYDCRNKPDKTDKASTGRIMLLTYRDYPSHWDEITGVFSRQAVLKGSFDKYAEAATGKRGTAEVDDAFLAEIERWRELLVHNIALRNPSLSQRDLNYAVQMTIDRLIFLRICEDRGIEFYGQLQSLLNGGETYPRLCQLFRKADERYNSGLFHFLPERDQADAPDMLTPGLLLDDKPLKDILANLYYPDSPYEFSVLPADILGQVYERFLGKVIRLTAGHHAVVEDKPEVKKAGGVFYTPTFIVEYIVKHTLGKLLEGKTPGQVGLGRGTPLRILDMSCGSGSFLLGAYQYLLDWYQSAYSLEPEKWSRGAAPRLYQVSSPDGALWMLTTSERKRILLDHIYGVDIDPQAVEVTKLSLLLKVLEGESQESIGKQLSMFRQRALPDLAGNIKCGNSLIGPDFYANQPAPQGTLPGFDLEEKYRINAFDWHREFANIFSSSGGFDVIIGNPPYVRPHNIPASIKKILWTSFSTFVAKSDLYTCFMEKGLSLTKSSGLFSFIVPQTWTSLESFTKIREYIIYNAKVCKLTQLPHKVFANATVETCIFLFQKSTACNDETEVFIEKLDFRGNISLIRKFPQKSIKEAYLYNFQLYGLYESQSINYKIKANGEPLKQFVNFSYGFKTADDKKFIHPSKLYEESKPFIRSSAIKRFWYESPIEYVWYVPEIMIHDHKTSRPGESARFESEKLIVARMGKALVAAYDAGGLYVKDAMLLHNRRAEYSLKYLLGILNSRLMNYYYKKFFITIDVLKNALLSLHIRPINFSDPTDIKLHNNLVILVERMLSLHQQLAISNTPNEKTLLQRQIDTTDHQIDALVYELYGLTDEEISLIEGGQ